MHSLLSWTMILSLSWGLPQDEKPSAPFGLPAILWPQENAWTLKAENLGKRLFSDPILSVDRSISCASCHDPDHGFASLEAIPPGARGKRALRHAPTLVNRAFGTSMMWDGRRTTLESQVLDPISNPNEMSLPHEEALKRLETHEKYPLLFRGAYTDGLNLQNLSRALSTYVRTILVGNSPVDRFHAGDSSSLTAQEKAGLWIYESKGGCWRCHSGPNFSDEGFHNTGVGVLGQKPEAGRAGVTEHSGDTGAFKTPTLRGLVHSPPYMHDGSIKTLREVVEFYRRGGNPNQHLDQAMVPLDLSEDDVLNLLAFLKALSRQ